MSGHNKWSGIKHRKEAQDNKRAAIFTKLATLITIAAREGGDPTMNFKLRLAVDNARAVNMPKENIERAIKRGTGELKDGAQIEELLYEGFSPANIPLLIRVLTDNRNRSIGEIKTIFNKNGGKFGESGSVQFLFRPAGIIVFEKEKIADRDAFDMAAIDAGAEDILEEEGAIVVITKPEDLKRAESALDAAHYAPADSSLGYLPIRKTKPSEEDAEKHERFLDLLDDHQDVQMVWDTLG